MKNKGKSNYRYIFIKRIIYNAVLDAQNKVNKAIRPGVNWGDMHLLAERTIVTHLHGAGLVVGDLEEIISKRIGALFFPVIFYLFISKKKILFME